jgi:hypothetical protein
MSYEIIVKGMNGKLIANNATYTHSNKKYTDTEFTIAIPIQ